MKKVSFIIAGLVSLLLVGCGGSEGNVASAGDDSTPSTVVDGTPSTGVVSLNSANNAAIQDGLPSIPDIPNE